MRDIALGLLEVHNSKQIEVFKILEDTTLLRKEAQNQKLLHLASSVESVTLSTESTNSSPIPMEFGAVQGPPAFVKTAAERLEYHRKGRCSGCGELEHIQSKCPSNLSRLLSLAATTHSEGAVSGKAIAQAKSRSSVLEYSPNYCSHVSTIRQ